eukprot:scaffold59398_cov69-Phaeocystis_antarctica.AAC.5
MWRQLYRSSVVSCGHPEANATTAASLTLSQPRRSSVVSCLQFEATAPTPTLVILLQLFR